MSVSKFESLPNEILIDIFEKYINGVDLLVAFAYSQNQRFGALISQCQQFSFNFLNCRKDHFYFCRHLLSTSYIEKIEELVLSEQNTPGQIQGFLSIFPSFIVFKRLRKLYLHLNAKSFDWSTIKKAFLSLSNTAIDTVSIKAIDAPRQPIFDYIINDIVSSNNIKRLFLTGTVQHDLLLLLSNDLSKVEYLINSSMSCKFENLPYIFRRASHLKYLNTHLTAKPYFDLHQLFNPTNDNIISIPPLQTLILSFEAHDSTTIDAVTQYLKGLPTLRRLEIKAHGALIDANAWEILLQTSLPLLTHFRLKTTISRIRKNDIENILASFETPFWIEKPNFYLIITEHKHLDSNTFSQNIMAGIDQDEFNQPVIQWWIVPIRARIDDIPMKDITSFAISGLANSLSNYYYLKNIKYLVIYNLDHNLLEWLITYVNYSRIEYLDVSLLGYQSRTMTSLLSYVRNVTSLRIQYHCLLVYRDIYLGRENRLKYLDISVYKHSFDKTHIDTISILFPNIEHLVINTSDLSNIPLLKTYLPHLCSLTFKISDDHLVLYGGRKLKQYDNYLRQQVKLQFQRYKEWITVWIDQAVLEEPYWQKFNSNSSTNNTAPKHKLPSPE